MKGLNDRATVILPLALGVMFPPVGLLLAGLSYQQGERDVALRTLIASITGVFVYLLLFA